MANNNAARAAAQERTLLAGPAQYGLPWEGEDLEAVVVFDDATAEELALALGRTEYSILAVRQALRDGRKVGSNRRVTQRDLEARAWAADDPRWG